MKYGTAFPTGVPLANPGSSRRPSPPMTPVLAAQAPAVDVDTFSRAPAPGRSGWAQTWLDGHTWGSALGYPFRAPLGKLLLGAASYKDDSDIHKAKHDLKFDVSDVPVVRA